MNSMTLPTRANADILESSYRAWLDNPDSVDATWRAFFQGFTLGTSGNLLNGVNGQATAEPAATSLSNSLKQSGMSSSEYPTTTGLWAF